MAHVGAALKTHLVNSVKNTWNTVYQLAMFSKVTSGRSIDYDPRIVSIFIIYYSIYISFGFVLGVYNSIILISHKQYLIIKNL